MFIGIGLPLTATGGAAAMFEPNASLALDFVNGRYRNGAGSGSSPDFASLPGLTVSRASVGYAETSDGTLVQFGTNVARITDKGLLVEEARTNLLLRSQEFDNASWVKTDLAVTANAINAPDGTLTADLLTEGVAGTGGIAANNVTVTASVASIDAVYLKRGNTDWVRVRLVGPGGVNAVNVWFNLATGAVGSVNNAGAATAGAGSVQALAGGWYRCVVAGVLSTDTTAFIQFMSAAADASFTRVNNATYYAWQADLNSNANFITSPIPTTSASATRAQDSVAILGLGTVLTPPFTMFSEADMYVTADAVNRYLLNASDAPAGNFAHIRRNAANAMRLSVSTAGVNSFVDTGTFTGTTRLKGAARIGSTDIALSGNGGAAVSTAKSPPGSLDRLYLGYDGNVGGFFNGYVRKAVIYPTAMTDAQLQALTQ